MSVSEKNMQELESAVQKNVVNFCEVLPKFVAKFKQALVNAKDPTRAIVNFSEQIRLIKQADMKSCIENFEEIQTNLQSKILLDIEEEITTLKSQINALNLLNQDLKNRLSNLEKSTIDLNWENKTSLIKGNAVQPPLSKILQMGYDFYVFFCNILNKIKEGLSNLNAYKEETVKCLENAVNLDIYKKNADENNNVTYLLAITQYVINNERSVTT